MQAINFIDLLMLRCIMEYERNHDTSIPIREMMRRANRFIDEHGVTHRYTYPIKSIAKAQASIEKWQTLGFLTPSAEGMPAKRQRWFSTTPETAALFERLREKWAAWPSEIPISGSPPALDWSRAIYPQS